MTPDPGARQRVLDREFCRSRRMQAEDLPWYIDGFVDVCEAMGLPFRETYRATAERIRGFGLDPAKELPY